MSLNVRSRSRPPAACSGPLPGSPATESGLASSYSVGPAVLYGSAIRTVNLAQATTQRKVVIEVISFGSVQFGTVKLKQGTSGKLVEIDRIVVSKT